MAIAKMALDEPIVPESFGAANYKKGDFYTQEGRHLV
jgi:hypothetical protein